MPIYGTFNKVQSIGDSLFVGEKQLPHTLSPNVWEFKKDDSNLLKSGWDKAKQGFPNSDETEIVDEEIYLFLFNQNAQWGGNFFHFHFHELQRLLGYLELRKTNPSLKLGIPKGIKNFQRSVIDSIVGDVEKVEFDIFNKSFIFNKCYVGEYSNIAEIPVNLFNILQAVGSGKINFEPTKSERMVYIGRRTGKGFAGDNRVMKNSIDFLKILETMNFEKIFFEDYDLEGKLTNLLNPSPKSSLLRLDPDLQISYSCQEVIYLSQKLS